MELEEALTQLHIVTQNQLVKAKAGASAISPYSGPQELYVFATEVLQNLLIVPDLVGRFFSRSNRKVLTDLVDQVSRKVQYLAASLGGTVIENPNTMKHDLLLICRNTVDILNPILSTYETEEDGGSQLTEATRREVFELRQQLQATEKSLLFDEELENVRRLAREAQDAVDATRQAAGQTGDLKLGQHYSDVSTIEFRSAVWFRVAAIVFFLAAIGLAGWVAYTVINDQQEGVTSQLFKFLTTVPALALAFWFSHESNNHRMVARRAKEVEVRLYTLEAFLAPLEPEQRAQLRTKVGESILVGPLALTPGTEKHALDAQAIIERLIDKAG